MSSKPTIDEIRARLANHTQVLAHRHYAKDVGGLLEMVDEAHEALRELACYVAAGGYNAPDPISVPEFVAKIRGGIDHNDDARAARIVELEAKLAGESARTGMLEAGWQASIEARLGIEIKPPAGEGERS